MSMLLQVRGLRAAYGQTEILRGLDFDVGKGAVTALLGANGAGKTTTLRALCGSIRRQGSITLDGVPISGKSTEEIVRLGVGHVPDGRGTFLKQSVENNLKLGAITRSDRQGIAEDIEKIYDYFPILKQRRSQQAGLLSGGEQQMLAVGRALMLRPKILLLDEPSFGLAPLVVREIFGIFRKLKEASGVGILLVEQNASLALDLADHAYVLETGRVGFSGKAEDVKNNEQLKRSYLG